MRCGDEELLSPSDAAYVSTLIAGGHDLFTLAIVEHRHAAGQPSKSCILCRTSQMPNREHSLGVADQSYQPTPFGK